MAQSDDVLMEFVLAPDESGKNILRTPLRVNAEELVRHGGVTVNGIGPDGKQRQTTLIVEAPGTGGGAGAAAAASHHHHHGHHGAAADGSNDPYQAAHRHANDPQNAQAFGYIRRETQLDAVEGRHAQSGQFYNQQHQHQQGGGGVMIAAGGGALSNAGGGTNNANFVDSEFAASTHVTNEEAIRNPREHKMRVCMAVNKRHFVPPPLRRFAATGYTNAVHGGDGLRRLLVCGGLSKVAVEHEIYEYSLCGQRWRRLECRAEQHTPQGLPIVPLARHSHSASVLLESGPGGQAYLVIVGGVGLGGRVVPPDGLLTRQSRAAFEELFGCDPESFANSVRIDESQMQTCSVLDIIQGSGDNNSGALSAGAGGGSRSGSTSVSHGHQVGVLDEVFELNLKSRVWRRVQIAGGQQPPHLCDHSCVMFGNRAIIYGGTTIEMIPAEGKFVHFLEIHRGSSSSSSSYRPASAASSSGGGGGRSRHYYWHTLALEPSPIGRARHSAVAVSADSMAVFGGTDANGVPLADLWLLNNVNTDAPVWAPISLGDSGDHHFAGGRTGHSVCMSHGHRMLVIGGQLEGGDIVDSVREIQLAPVLLDGAAEAVVRSVRTAGDSIPRFAFGCAMSAGDGVSGMIFGGTKRWVEDLKKLQALKNPTTEEIQRSRRKAQEYEQLTNSVHIFTFELLTGRAKRRAVAEALGTEMTDSDESNDSNMSAAEMRRRAPVPKSFLKCVDRMHEGYSHMWDETREKQQKIADDAKSYAATRIFIGKQQVDYLYDMLDDAVAFLGRASPEHLPDRANEKTERANVLMEAHTAISQALQSSGLDKNKRPTVRMTRAGEIEDSSQQLHYIVIEEHLNKCMAAINRTRALNDTWYDVTVELMQWLEQYKLYWQQAAEKVLMVLNYVRGVKRGIVDATLRRLDLAEQKSRMLREEMVAAEARKEAELKSKTAMQFVLEERAAANRKPQGQISGKRANSARPTSPTKRERELAEAAERRRKMKHKKKVKTYPTPEYGEQVPDLEIDIIDNDRRVHGRLVRLCQTEIDELNKAVYRVPQLFRQQRYGNVEGSIAQFATCLHTVEQDLPKTGGNQHQQQQQAQAGGGASAGGGGGGAFQAGSGGAFQGHGSPMAPAAAPSKDVWGPNAQDIWASAAPPSTLKSQTALRHSKDLVDCGQLLVQQVEAAADPSVIDVPILEQIKNCAENLAKVSRSFRQYWHLTFLSRGYERGGEAGAQQRKELAERVRKQRSPNQRRGPTATGTSTTTGVWADGRAPKEDSDQDDGSRSRGRRRPFSPAGGYRTLATRPQERGGNDMASLAAAGRARREAREAARSQSQPRRGASAGGVQPARDNRRPPSVGGANRRSQSPFTGHGVGGTGGAPATAARRNYPVHIAAIPPGTDQLLQQQQAEQQQREQAYAASLRPAGAEVTFPAASPALMTTGVNEHHAAAAAGGPAIPPLHPATAGGGGPSIGPSLGPSIGGGGGSGTFIPAPAPPGALGGPSIGGGGMPAASPIGGGGGGGGGGWSVVSGGHQQNQPNQQHGGGGGGAAAPEDPNVSLSANAQMHWIQPSSGTQVGTSTSGTVSGAGSGIGVDNVAPPGFGAHPTPAPPASAHLPYGAVAHHHPAGVAVGGSSAAANAPPPPQVGAYPSTAQHQQRLQGQGSGGARQSSQQQHEHYDDLFQNKRNLTLGERRILEARRGGGGKK